MDVLNESCQVLCTQSFDKTGLLSESVFRETLTGNLIRNISSMDELVEKSDVEEDNLVVSSQQNRMRIALGVLVRLVLPLCHGFVKGLQGIRGIRILKALQNLRGSRQMLTNMLAYAANSISMGLSSVQVHRIEPLLKIMKLRKGSTDCKSITFESQYPILISRGSIASPTPSLPVKRLMDDEPEKCVTMNILAEPPPGTPIRAHIIFIHGLHGSLVNTWKQGLWNSEGRKVEFERPPRPPMRRPKRPRHSRGAHFTPPHFHKRPRYCADFSSSAFHPQDAWDENVFTVDPDRQPMHSSSYTYECGDPEVIDNCYGIEYSFPTFRLRLDDRKIPPMSRQDSASSSGVSSCESTPMDEYPPTITMPKDETQQKQNNPTSEKYSKCWPGDWLPLDCPGVRVIALNYTTDPYLWRPMWVRKRNRTTITERCRQMTELLIKEKVGYGHPIIWVGHSKGGLFIKQIITSAWESGRPAAAPLWRASRGVFFYSVPHRGSALADFQLPFLRRSIELLELRKNDSSMLELHKRFVALYQSGHLKIDVFSFVETALTLMSVLYLRIVGVDSADPGIGEVCGLHLDHREICKPRSRNCILYTELVKMINRVS